MSILDRIQSRDDLLALTKDEQTRLCAEIREFLIRHVSDCGGHLASNLGVVEATVALHKVYDTSRDRLVFDVGHQCYVHKLLTGRKDGFETLRQFGGISGFPRPDESAHDAFIAGHASDSVSVALGMARARTMQGEDYDVVAFLGDGALTGGLAFEGLNDAGASGEKLTVVLNDNGMSIGRNVGGISRHLSLLRLKPRYFLLKKSWRRFTSSFPGGKPLYRFVHWIKARLKRSLIGTTLFEEMGWTYLGPVDGHDVDRVAYLLSVAKELPDQPVLLHIITQKGKGYAPAEKDPQSYHGVGKFDPEVGIRKERKPRTFSEAFGDAMIELAAEVPQLCAITAAMEQGTGLDCYAKLCPDRFFDVGIAEGHAVSMAAGMAKQGAIPVVALYSTFLQRAYDMLLHDISILGLHVVFAVDRCGLVGEDGATHHGVFDVGYLRQIPGMTVLTPVDGEELRAMLREAVLDRQGPVAIRYPRGRCAPFEAPAPADEPQLTLVTYGEMSAVCADAIASLRGEGISCELLRLRCIKPLPLEEILTAAKKTTRFLIVEDTTADCCCGSEILAALQSESVDCRCRTMNFGDRFLPHGDLASLYRMAGLDAESICRAAREVLSS
ncbi:MAG: 1-deoxy-D-xylulose-5-phosphate synthase [Oscillospiraceae bacterium]|nr:1-deoxy-D-xylulose-5-phosphate synthase [Oscillospiraceae bacterium]